jgi:hypothetical protein
MVAMERVQAEAPDDNGAGAEEATVTFVARDPPPSRHETASVSGHDPAEADDDALSYPLGADIEEAEVTILKDDQVDQRRQTAQRDGNLRRFRRALLGD